MCTSVSIVCQHFQQSDELLLIDPLKFTADRSLHLWCRKVIELGKRAKGEGIDQNPERYISMNPLIMFKVSVLAFPGKKRIQMFIDQHLNPSPALRRTSIEISSIQIGRLLVAKDVTECIAQQRSDVAFDLQKIMQCQLP